MNIEDVVRHLNDDEKLGKISEGVDAISRELMDVHSMIVSLKDYANDSVQRNCLIQASIKLEEGGMWAKRFLELVLTRLMNTQMASESLKTNEASN